MKSLKIACASDIHGKWEELDYPPADILILAGDILANYSPSRTVDASIQVEELKRLNNFFYWKKDDGTYKEVVFVAGNHDFAFQIMPEKAREALSDIVYLQDEATTIDGVKFYGSPWQPWFFDWAFNFPNHHDNFFRARAHARACWDKIPIDTHVLITHGPPFDVLDLCCDGRKVGCHYLRDRIDDDLKGLKLHTFGHIHYSYGQKVLKPLAKNPTQFVNAAVCRENYRACNPIQVIEIENDDE